MKSLICTFSLTALVCIFTACNSGSETEKDSVEMAKEQNDVLDSSRSTNPDELKDDNNFLVEAASGGMMEVELGNIAAANAASAQVKKFASMMVEDHSKANKELTELARLKNIAVPNAPGEKHQEHINELKSKKGKDFDKAYMDLMVDDHYEDVSKFEDASKNAKDEDIKAFATKTLQVLKHHQEEAKKIKEKL